MTSTSVMTEAAKELLLYLPNPKHAFHGDHWYHMGEYYLSRMPTVQDMLTHVEGDNIHVKLVSSNPLLHRMLTPFTWFILVLMVWSSKVAEVSLLHPQVSFSEPSASTLDIAPALITHYFQNSNTFNFQPIGNASSSTSGVFLGSLENSPIATKKWFASKADLNKLQLNLGLLCPTSAAEPVIEVNIGNEGYEYLNNSGSGGINVLGRQKKRLIIYQRDQTRRIINLDYLMHHDLIIIDWEVEVLVHSDAQSPCDLYHHLQRCDVLLTTHGFQLASIFMLPPRATVIEIFPYRYFKPSYFPLYSPLQLQHHWFQSTFRTSAAGFFLDGITQQVCMGDKACRSFARNQDIQLSIDEWNLVLHILLSTAASPTT